MTPNGEIRDRLFTTLARRLRTKKKITKVTKHCLQTRRLDKSRSDFIDNFRYWIRMMLKTYDLRNVFVNSFKIYLE